MLVAVLFFVLHNSTSGQAYSKTGIVSTNSVVSPLDQLSSADIAVNVARLTNIAEATSATNRADTVNALLTLAPAEQTVVAKPQVVATAFKSNKDIKIYVTINGDTVNKLADKFHVTSDSILASNGLTGNQLSVGKKLYIPPMNGIVYKVKRGDTPANLASKYNAEKDQIIAFNDAEIGGLRPGTLIIIPNGILPTATVTTQYYGYVGFGYSASYGANGYDYGWCTWYAANRRAALGHPVPSNLGNAYSWFFLAQRAGIPTGYTPRVGAVAVVLGGNHVSVVEKVNANGSFWVSEMNAGGQVSITNTAYAGGWGQVDYKLYSSAGGLGFIY